jgi:alkyldihydroxyacetonephosphate synthase
MNRVEQVNA